MKPETTTVTAAIGDPMVCYLRRLWLGHGPGSAHSTGRLAGAIDPGDTGE